MIQGSIASLYQAVVFRRLESVIAIPSMGLFKCYVTQWGCRISWKKPVTKVYGSTLALREGGSVGVKFPGKKRYVILGWPLSYTYFASLYRYSMYHVSSSTRLFSCRLPRHHRVCLSRSNTTLHLCYVRGGPSLSAPWPGVTTPSQATYSRRT